MRTLFRLLTLVLLAGPAWGEIGYTFSGDLNNDGIVDHIRSGPQTSFGNAGGLFSIELSAEDSTTHSVVVFLHPLAIAIERGPDANRLWGYIRGSGRTGVLLSVELEDTFAVERVTIHPGDGGTEIGRSIYATIFAPENLIRLERVEEYVPPEQTWSSSR